MNNKIRGYETALNPLTESTIIEKGAYLLFKCPGL